jgi:hypothetical protein
MSQATETRENRGFASELKFLIPPALAEEIRDWARARVGPDPYGVGEMGDSYQVTSLYFDTQHFDVFHRKGSFARSKYRVRRYCLGEVAFLERKLRTRNLVSKRRSIVAVDELKRLGDAEVEDDWAGYWFHRRLLARALKPVCQISYLRTARVSMTGRGPIRLTLDQNIRALPVGGVAFDHFTEGALLSEEHCILELKYIRDMPAVFKHLVEEFALNPQRVSKYRLAASALGCVAKGVSEPSYA